MTSEQCPESGNALFGHWSRGATLRCDYCLRTVTAQNSGGGWRVPRHNKTASQAAEKGEICAAVGSPPGLTWKGPLGTPRTFCNICSRDVTVRNGLVARHFDRHKAR